MFVSKDLSTQRCYQRRGESLLKSRESMYRSAFFTELKWRASRMLPYEMIKVRLILEVQLECYFCNGFICGTEEYFRFQQQHIIDDIPGRFAGIFFHHF